MLQELLGRVGVDGRGGSTGDLGIKGIRSQINPSGPHYRARFGIDGHSREESKILPCPENTFPHQMNQGNLTLDSVCESDPESIAGSGLHAGMGQIWRIRSLILSLVNPSWPQKCVLQRPHYWIPLPANGEVPAKWPVAIISGACSNA